MLAGVKTLLLLSEAFPQAPIRPLGLLTRRPEHAALQLDFPHGRVNADLFLPSGGRAQAAPGLVLAMGVKTSAKDRPVILKFAESLARLGFAVLWPRLALLDEGRDLPDRKSVV